MKKLVNLFRALFAVGIVQNQQDVVAEIPAEICNEIVPAPASAIPVLTPPPVAVTKRANRDIAIPTPNGNGILKKVRFLSAKGNYLVAKVLARDGNTVVLSRNNGPRFVRRLSIV